MKLCVREAFASFSFCKEYEYELTAAELGQLPQGAEFGTVKARIKISSQSGVVTCGMEVDTTFSTVCSRCVKPITLPLHITNERIVRKEQCEDFEDVIYTDTAMCIDIVEELRDLIFFEFPAKPLCSEDCKGLCPVCGCDLNTENCSCDIRTVDPRLAVLKKLIDK